MALFRSTLSFVFTLFLVVIVVMIAVPGVESVLTHRMTSPSMWVEWYDGILDYSLVPLRRGVPQYQYAYNVSWLQTVEQTRFGPYFPTNDPALIPPVVASYPFPKSGWEIASINETDAQTGLLYQELNYTMYINESFNFRVRYVMYLEDTNVTLFEDDQFVVKANSLKFTVYVNGFEFRNQSNVVSLTAQCVAPETITKVEYGVGSSVAGETSIVTKHTRLNLGVVYSAVLDETKLQRMVTIANPLYYNGTKDSYGVVLGFQLPFFRNMTYDPSFSIILGGEKKSSNRAQVIGLAVAIPAAVILAFVIGVIIFLFLRNEKKKGKATMQRAADKMRAFTSGTTASNPSASSDVGNSKASSLLMSSGGSAASE